jgi:hypothetical protein
MMISIAPMSPSRRRLARMSASRSVEWRWCHEEAGERLQPQERLLGGAQKAEGQAKPVETGGPALVQSLYVVHCDDRVPTDPRPVTTLQLDRLFPAEDIDWIWNWRISAKFSTRTRCAGEFQPASTMKM